MSVDVDTKIPIQVVKTPPSPPASDAGSEVSAVAVSSTNVGPSHDGAATSIDSEQDSALKFPSRLYDLLETGNTNTASTSAAMADLATQIKELRGLLTGLTGPTGDQGLSGFRVFEAKKAKETNILDPVGTVMKGFAKPCDYEVFGKEGLTLGNALLIGGLASSYAPNAINSYAADTISSAYDWASGTVSGIAGDATAYVKHTDWSSLARDYAPSNSSLAITAAVGLGAAAAYKGWQYLTAKSDVEDAEKATEEVSSIEPDTSPSFYTRARSNFSSILPFASWMKAGPMLTQ